VDQKLLMGASVKPWWITPKPGITFRINLLIKNSRDWQVKLLPLDNSLSLLSSLQVLHPCQLTWLEDSMLLDVLSPVASSTFGCFSDPCIMLLDNSDNKLSLPIKLMSTTLMYAHAREMLKTSRKCWLSQDNKPMSSPHAQRSD